MPNAVPFLLKLTQSRDPVFTGAFAVSFCLHVTLILGLNNTFLRWGSLKSDFTSYPSIVYTGSAESEIGTGVIKAEARPSSGEVTQTGHQGLAVHLPEQIVRARTGLQDLRKNISQGLKRAGELSKPVKIPKRAARQARVENIDLTDTHVFQVFASYYSRLSGLIKAQSRYPPEVITEAKEGLVYITFVLHRDGKISKLAVVEGSGDARLDGAALKSIRDSVPFPAFPSEIKENKITFYLPVSFEVD